MYLKKYIKIAHVPVHVFEVVEIFIPHLNSKGTVFCLIEALWANAFAQVIRQ